MTTPTSFTTTHTSHPAGRVRSATSPRRSVSRHVGASSRATVPARGHEAVRPSVGSPAASQSCLPLAYSYTSPKPRLSSRHAARGLRSQGSSQQYTTTGLEGSRRRRASTSIRRRGMLIAPGRCSSSNSSWGRTSTSWTPWSSSLRTSSRSIERGIAGSGRGGLQALQERAQPEAQRDQQDPEHHRVRADGPHDGHGALAGEDQDQRGEHDRGHADQSQEPFALHDLPEPDRRGDLEHAGGQRPGGNQEQERERRGTGPHRGEHGYADTGHPLEGQDPPPPPPPRAPATPPRTRRSRPPLHTPRTGTPAPAP